MTFPPIGPLTADEDLLLAEPGARPARREHERLERIRAEAERGFTTLAELGPAVSVFGSARSEPGTDEYELARRTARALGRDGWAVITGGGPGIMEAANLGAREAGAHSVGLNIELPHEQEANPHLDTSLEFRYFFVRRLMFVRYASGFVVHPGGFGTLDEMFEALTLIQTEKIARFPVVLVGTDYWEDLLQWMRRHLLEEGRVEPRDLADLHLTDDPEGVCRHLRARGAPSGG